MLTRQKSMAGDVKEKSTKSSIPPKKLAQWMKASVEPSASIEPKKTTLIMLNSSATAARRVSSKWYTLIALPAASTKQTHHNLFAASSQRQDTVAQAAETADIERRDTERALGLTSEIWEEGGETARAQGSTAHSVREEAGQDCSLAVPPLSTHGFKATAEGELLEAEACIGVAYA